MDNVLLIRQQQLQDPEGGGIADRPGDMVDVFHTLFGVAGEWHRVIAALFLTAM